MFSLPKLLVLILFAVAGWWLYKTIKRRDLAGTRARAARAEAAHPKALDMEKCRICGDFVPSDARACATEPRCPYPRG